MQGDGSVAVVTGGASGIGRATCARLGADGWRLAVLDRDGAGAMEAGGDGGVGLAVDVGDAAQVDAAIGDVRARFGRIDLLVNNAGITGPPTATTCHETPIEEWDRVLAVNVRGPFLCSRAVLPIMIEQGRGHIITVASVAGMVATPGRAAYTTSKGAALMFTKSLAVDYAQHGIRANAVCPGWVQTPMTQWRIGIPELRDKLLEAIPMGRVCQPEEIAEAIAVLADARLAYVTGHAFVIDGGMTATMSL
jgi:NAD(P)-dependent dehydrogenase (short-subunit alcohol dehydrogenase family)